MPLTTHESSGLGLPSLFAKTIKSPSPWGTPSRLAVRTSPQLVETLVCSMVCSAKIVSAESSTMVTMSKTPAGIFSCVNSTNKLDALGFVGSVVAVFQEVVDLGTNGNHLCLHCIGLLLVFDHNVFPLRPLLLGFVTFVSCFQLWPFAMLLFIIAYFM